MERVVEFDGTIDGSGVHATCRVRATEVTLGDELSEITNWEVLRTSPLLPDGDYTIRAGGFDEKVQLSNGQWLSRS